jgi:hypothetical protein
MHSETIHGREGDEQRSKEWIHSLTMRRPSQRETSRKYPPQMNCKPIEFQERPIFDTVNQEGPKSL